MFILNPYTAKPNTIIGGVGSVITTKSALATKLGISESIIKNFEVVGSDVYCRIVADYFLKYQAFLADSTIDFFHDLEGKSLGSITGYAFSGSTVQSVTFPNWTNVADWTFYNTPNLNEFIGDNLTTIQNNGFRLSNISSANFANVTTVGSYGLGSSKFSVLNMPSLTSMTDGQNLRLITPLTSFVADNLASIDNKDSVFRSLPNCNLISMKKLKTFGNPAVESNCFASLKTNCLIEVNEALLTTNSGSPDAALVWVKANRSAVVEFYDDSGNYVSTL